MYIYIYMYVYIYIYFPLLSLLPRGLYTIVLAPIVYDA